MSIYISDQMLSPRLMNDIGCYSVAVTGAKEPSEVPVHLSDYINNHPPQRAMFTSHYYDLN